MRRLLTFGPDRGLRHDAVHNAAEQQRPDPRWDLRVTVHDHLQVPRRVHHFKVHAPPVLLGVEERSVGGCRDADVGGPYAGEGRYRMAHDARGEKLRLVVSRGEAVRRGACLERKLAEDGVRGFVVSDDATPYSVSGPDDVERRKGEGHTSSSLG